MKNIPIVRRLTAEEMSESIIQETTDLYMEVFNFHHYLLFSSTLEILGVRDVFRSTRYPDLKTQHAIKQMPVHAETGEQAIFWHHPETTYRILKKRLMRDSTNSTFLIDPQTEEIIGAIIGDKTSLCDLFDDNGWTNPTLYAGIEAKQHCRSPESLLQQINDTLKNLKPNRASSQILRHITQFRPGEKVLSPNCIALKKKARHNDSLSLLFSGFLASLPNESKTIPFVFEATWQSGLTKICLRSGMILINGTLRDPDAEKKDGDSVIIVGDYDCFCKAGQILNRLNSINMKNQFTGRSPFRPKFQ
ncbi:hypothetical protein KKI24_01775 [bacterium]|nr:hypothetical protein [bacterium]